MNEANITSSHSWDTRRLDKLVDELQSIRASLLEFESSFAPQIAELDDSWRHSAINLLHYVALRRFDLRQLQESLAELGLSSLGRAEPHVLANIDAVLRVLKLMTTGHAPKSGGFQGFNHTSPAALLDARAQTLFGRHREKRSVRIMVTLASDAAWL